MIFAILICFVCLLVVEIIKVQPIRCECYYVPPYECLCYQLLLHVSKQIDNAKTS